MKRKVPMSLVTGFLGCGKTTFLQQAIKHYTDKKIVYLVNEFSPADVDGQLLKEHSDSLVSIAGGSIFCKCLVGEFIRQLREIKIKFDSAESPIDGVIIESSGIANPMVIKQMLSETQLTEIYELSSIINITEPKSFLKLIHTLPNIKAQIEASNVVIINKIDSCREPEIAKTEDQISSINASAKITRSSFCDVDLANSVNLFAESFDKNLTGEYAKCIDPNYDKFKIEFEEAVDLKKLISLIENHSEQIYRAKGFVPTNDGVVYLDYTLTQLRTEKMFNTNTSNELAFIMDGKNREISEKFISDLKKNTSL